ncbi:MAG: sigma-54 dependent transcriptional regulator [Acidobacteria bacterium]|jgi:DNA-binding NtrC family response regulator|nr:sigma-54 dependent transcriptional regulator [Acidobacteriota bacterium]
MNIKIESTGKKILVVDDDSDGIALLRKILKDAQYEFFSAESGKEALDLVKIIFFPVVLLDIRMPGMDGIEVLKHLQIESPQSMVILLTAYGSPENIERALNARVHDILDKPIDNNLLLLKLENAFRLFETKLKNEQIEKELLNKYPYRNIIGASPKLINILKTLEKIAPTDAAVLITGENGTGKELIARAIHDRSKRKCEPFTTVNAAALPESLLESELFGYEKGAFTGASARKIGYFEYCQKGTIFLDEIGDVSLTTQVKLLRVLQEKQINRLGNAKLIDIDVRIITATNKEIKKLLQEKQLREDLYFRINTIHIHLPPLRERKEDIPFLINHFLKKFSHKEIKVSDAAVVRLMEYDYPGNVRELGHIIEQAVILQEDNLILPSHLPVEVVGKQVISNFTELLKHPWKEAKALFEQRYIESALERAGGNVSVAARETGIDRSYFQKQIKKYRINRLEH